MVYNVGNILRIFCLILMNDVTLLVIEGKHADHPAFVPALRKKGFVVEAVSNGSEASARLAGGFTPDVVVVNAASLRTSGKRICQSLREETAKTVFMRDRCAWMLKSALSVAWASRPA